MAKTNSSGVLTYQAAYEGFGKRTQEYGSTLDRQKASTKDEDPTGLLNEGFRYRDLDTGSFINKDPLGFVDGPNLYTYVNQNPWTSFDPQGLWGIFGFEFSGRSAEEAAHDIGSFTFGVYTGASKLVSGAGQAIAHPIKTAENAATGIHDTVAAVATFAGEASVDPQAAASKVVQTATHAVSEIANHPDNIAQNIGEALPAVEVGIATGPAVGAVGDAAAPLLKGLKGAGELVKDATEVAEVVNTTTKEAVAVTDVTTTAVKTTDEATSVVEGHCGTDQSCFVAGTLLATADGEVPIESLRVGDRVLTSGSSQQDSSTDVNPSTWHTIKVHMPNPVRANDQIEIELLRSPEWMKQEHCEQGAQVWIEMPEMGVSGFAHVDEIRPSTVIHGGSGRVVTATITHLHGFVLRLKFEGTQETLSPTNNHKIYSETQHDWIQAGRLNPGELLRTQTGALQLASIERLPGVHRVYNIEVEAEHRYFVGYERVLCHNFCAADVDSAPNKPSSAGKMQREVEKGQAPAGVERVDKGAIEGQEDHVHYTDGTSSTVSGATHDKINGIPNPSNKIRKWLEKHNWTPPPKST